MSETVTEAPAETTQTAPQAADDGAAPTEAQEQPAAQEAATEAAPPATETAATEEKPAKKAGDRRFAQITARLSAESTARARAEQEAASLRAMLESRAAGEDTPARPAPQAQPGQEAVRAAAAQLVAEQTAEQRRVAIVDAGHKEYGAEAWKEKADTLHGLGATQNRAFMDALVEADHAPQIVSELADDPDLLAELLTKSPTAIATRLGRMDAKFSTPKTQAVSKAPPPAPKVGGVAVAPAPDIYNARLSMREWADAWDKYAPPHLGGKRRATG